MQAWKIINLFMLVRNLYFVLTSLVFGSAVSRAVSAHLVKSILGITPLLHGTLGFLECNNNCFKSIILLVAQSL